MNTVAEQKIAQMRLRVAYEKERDKLREFISREGKKYDNPAHQAQVRKAAAAVVERAVVFWWLNTYRLVFMHSLVIANGGA